MPQIAAALDGITDMDSKMIDNCQSFSAGAPRLDLVVAKLVLPIVPIIPVRVAAKIAPLPLGDLGSKFRAIRRVFATLVALSFALLLPNRSTPFLPLLLLFAP